MTTLEEISDIFLSLIQDYRLTALYQSSGSTSLLAYIEPWLQQSIDEFDVCDQALVYDSSSQAFSVELTQKNKNILARIMTMFWLQKELQNIQQMNNFIQDKDFKTHSMSQAYKAKQDAYAAKREEISQLLLSYGFRHNNWDDWADQNFS